MSQKVRMSHRENLRKARAHLIESFEKGLQPAGVVALQGFEVASWLVSVPPSVLITLQTPLSARVTQNVISMETMW